MAQSYAALYCHIIFSTKHREPLISRELQPRLLVYMGGVLRDEGNTLLAAGGMPDHVHLLASLSRQTSVAETVRLVKADSSGWVHKTYPALSGFAWQNGYGAFSVSGSCLPAVKLYLAGQEEHHRICTFQAEFVEFLRKHEIEYDECYLWE
jgi:putative transposase